VTRTLVVSDLHLGARLGHDVLRHPEPRRRLLDALDGIDRLVLLGDTIELMERRQRQALAIAEPVMRAVGERLGPERSVLFVPGNHDSPLIRAWVRAQGRDLQPSAEVPLDASETLARVASWLAPAKLEVRYPGAWLSERVWATHGHYLDRHLIPVSAYGVARGLLRRRPPTPATPFDYELARRPSTARFAGSVPLPVAELLNDLAELLRAATMPRVRRRLLTPRFAPLTSALLGVQMRRASMPALMRVAAQLGIDADWVVFGHVHRLGPLAEDDPLEWAGADGRPRLANTGSWLYEPLLVNGAIAPHPYWPGGALLIEDGGDPQAIGLLDDLPPDQLR
jgi:UDP-2,3-diacylglucosamine pyrophosphatase LpxH